MPIDAIIFDLDGTLLNTLDDIAAAANHALAGLGMPTHAVGDYRLMVGDGADVLMQRALPAGQRALAVQAVGGFKAYYRRHAFDHTRFYDGMESLLDELVRRAVPIAVLSNKPHENTLLVVQQMLDRWPWAAVAGLRDDVPRKPNPAGALNIAAQIGLPPQRFAFLGDSHIDMRTANAAGMTAIGALWGFRDRDELVRSGAHHLVETPVEVLDLLNGRFPRK